MIRKRPEQSLQRTIASYLRWALAPPAMFTSFPAGGGGLMRGHELKGTGLRAGMPDLLIFHDGRAYGLELKTGSVPLSEAQIITHAALRQAKIPVAVVRSLEELQALFAGPWYPLMACIRESKPSTERIRAGFTKPQDWPASDI